MAQIKRNYELYERVVLSLNRKRSALETQILMILVTALRGEYMECQSKISLN